MKFFIRVLAVFILTAVFFIACEQKKGVTDNNQKTDFSGIYCITSMNLELSVVQTGDNITFTLQTDSGVLNGTGTAAGDTLKLTAPVSETETFSCPFVFSQDLQSLSGTYQTTDTAGTVTSEGMLYGSKGVCPTYDILVNGIPEFADADFTQLSKIEKISKFRSSEGHDYSDSFETCRNMKHYYSPYAIYQENNTVEIYSPVDGTINSVMNDGHGASIGLKNKQIQITPDEQPAFIIRIFHCDLVSSGIAAGKNVQAGELLGYGRLYYDDLGEYANSFDIAVWVNTAAGIRQVSYFAIMENTVFNAYIARGAVSRDDFIISQEERDADPLECSGETFLNRGNLENWVVLH